MPTLHQFHLPQKYGRIDYFPEDWMKPPCLDGESLSQQVSLYFYVNLLKFIFTYTYIRWETFTN